MATRLKKLRSVVAILVTGMMVAVVFHAFQDLVLKRGYPWSSFLWRPEHSFDDFYVTVECAAHSSPYSTWAIYFPFTYVAFRPASLLPLGWSLILFNATALTAITLWLCELFHRATRSVGVSAAGAGLILLGAYPLWFCIDRGNIELGMLALVCGFMFFAERRRHWLGLAFLIPVICTKLYPAMLLAVYCRRGRFRFAVTGGLAAAIVTALSLASFEHSWQADLALWQHQFTKFHSSYLVGDLGMGGSSALWNPLKLFYYATLDRGAASAVVGAVETMLELYSLAMLACMAFLIWHVTVVEKELRRKFAILLLFMLLSTPGGADYKLVYIVALLALCVTTKSSRRGDWFVVVVLALVAVPKKYWFFPNVMTDSGASDCSMGVAVNPALMLSALVVLCRDGWAARAERVRAACSTRTSTPGNGFETDPRSPGGCAA